MAELAVRHCPLCDIQARLTACWCCDQPTLPGSLPTAGVTLLHPQAGLTLAEVIGPGG